MPDTKIATCCYCGTRAALKLVGTVQHELVCSRCGAPLHELRQIPVHRLASPPKPKAPKLSPIPVRQRVGPTSNRKKKKKKCKHSKKKQRSYGYFARKLFDEAFDTIEDIFD